VKAQVQINASVHEQIDDPGLLEEVTNLVEQPTALLGNFEQKYLALPKDVLITVMKKHQRYFPVLSTPGGRMSAGSPDYRPAGAGEMLPHFVAVRNGNSDNLGIVRHGNEECCAPATAMLNISSITIASTS
jgi:glycyl-tRNA synthetase beta subunit